MSNTKHYIWSAIGKFGTEILSFLGNILIARILMPEDYGLIAILALFINLSINLSDAGLNDALIRKKECDKKDIGTIATYNMAMAAIIYCIMFSSAPFLADFFDKEELTNITRILAIGIILKAFTLSGFVQLTKYLKFKHIAIINICCSTISIVTTYTIALLGFRYWALVFQPISIALSNILLLIIIAKWKPYFCFHWNRFKQMFVFSSNLLFSYIISTFGNNIYGFIIGKFYIPMELGYYNQAHKMQTVPTMGLNNIILTTSYPIIAKEQDDTKKRQIYISLFKNYNFITTWIVFSFICIADITFYLLFGSKWMPASPLFQIFILIALTYPLMTINANIIKIQGKSNIYRNLSVIRTLLQITALSICAPISIPAIVWGQVVASFLSASIDMYFCGRTINFSMQTQYKIWMKIIWKPLLSFILSGVLSICITNDIILHSILWFSFYTAFLVALFELTIDYNYKRLKSKLIHKLNYKYETYRKNKIIQG